MPQLSVRGSLRGGVPLDRMSRIRGDAFRTLYGSSCYVAGLPNASTDPQWNTFTVSSPSDYLSLCFRFRPTKYPVSTIPRTHGCRIIPPSPLGLPFSFDLFTIFMTPSLYKKTILGVIGDLPLLPQSVDQHPTFKPQASDENEEGKTSGAPVVPCREPCIILEATWSIEIGIYKETSGPRLQLRQGSALECLGHVTKNPDDVIEPKGVKRSALNPLASPRDHYG